MKNGFDPQGFNRRAATRIFSQTVSEATSGGAGRTLEPGCWEKIPATGNFHNHDVDFRPNFSMRYRT